ncbi:MAG: hypothetical protein BRC29_04335 [Nanohaloarchaea archaeon SW_7_43_1]|nr:MAG: hypothetical protein BRC29_04335 [Nanohaloarchaea archaeon SW_7_43_1]
MEERNKISPVIQNPAQYPQKNWMGSAQFPFSFQPCNLQQFCHQKISASISGQLSKSINLRRYITLVKLVDRNTFGIK